jgi:hypothetical protein
VHHGSIYQEITNRCHVTVFYLAGRTILLPYQRLHMQLILLISWWWTRTVSDTCRELTGNKILWRDICWLFLDKLKVICGRYYICSAMRHKHSEPYVRVITKNSNTIKNLFSFYLAKQPPPPWAMASSVTRFLDHTQRRTAVGRTPLEEWLARRRDLYLTKHTTITTDRHPCPPVGFESTISVGEQPQTYALDRAATGTGKNLVTIL